METNRYIYIFDYCSGRIIEAIISEQDYATMSAEEIITQLGFNLDECEWMDASNERQTIQTINFKRK